MTVVTLILLIFVICAVLGAVAILSLRLFPNLINDEARRQIKSATPILTLLFGTSITLAAAIATVSLGNTTKSLIEKQNRRELQIIMQKEVDAINEKFTDLTIALSNILAGGLGILGTVTIEMDRNPNFLDEAYQALPDGLAVEVAVFVDALDALIVALHSVQSHPIANRLLTHQLDESPSALEYLYKRSQDLGITHHDDIRILDIVTFRHYVRRARDALAVSSVHAIAQALLTSEFSQTSDSSTVHGELRWVAFSGYLISVADVESSSGDYYLMSRGLGMLHDLFSSLPDAERIVDYVREVMGDERKEIGLVCDFNPRILIGAGNASGISDLQTRLDLTIVKSKLPFPLSLLDDIAYQSASNESATENLDDVAVVGSLHLEDTATGIMNEDDVLSFGSLQAWTLQATKGDRVAIALAAEQFDTYLYVDGPGLLEPLVNDDREEDNTNSLVCVELPETGTLRVLVGAYDGATPGDRYVLQATVTDAAAVCDDFEGL